MNNIETESKKYIDFSVKYLSDEANFNLAYGSIRAILKGACEPKKRKTFLRNLKVKITNGSIEHGAPLTDFEEIDKEIEAEILDLFGYLMLRYYAFKKLSKKKRYPGRIKEGASKL